MSQAPKARYEQLLALGVCGLELAREGRLSELAACLHAREELIRQLPSQASAEARATLERCLIIEGHIEAELNASRGSVLAALSDLRRAQRTADGYMPARPRRSVITADA